jgi:hypothetical protein
VYDNERTVEDAVGHLRKEGGRHKDLSYPAPLQLTDETILSDYEGIISQLSAQGMTIDNELKALLLMSTLPPSWETFVTTVRNASAVAVKYSKTTSSILSEDARRKTFVQNSTSKAYTVQSTGDR